MIGHAAVVTPGAGARVCVTGGLGFIGSHLCRALADRGYEVVAIDALKGSYAAGAGGAAATELSGWSGVSVVHADLAVDSVGPLLEGARGVIHLAALPGVRSARPFAELWTHNVLTTRRIAAALEPGQRLVLASSSSIYGNAARLPTPEDCARSPLNRYGMSKLAAESECSLAASSRGVEAVIARLFTVFGPSQRPDMAFSAWIHAILDDRPVPWLAATGARREFTYVDDAVRGLIGALEHGRSGESYNMAGSGSTPVREALGEIEALLGRRARLWKRNGRSEASATAACGDKAREELAYAPKVSLSEGLRLQVEAAVGALHAGAVGAPAPALLA